MLQYNDLKVETLRHHNLVLCLLCHLDAFKFFSFLRNSLLLKKKKRKKENHLLYFRYLALLLSLTFSWFTGPVVFLPSHRAWYKFFRCRCAFIPRGGS